MKLKFLVRRKHKRWAKGKGALTKEQLNYFDKKIHQGWWVRIWER